MTPEYATFLQFYLAAGVAIVMLLRMMTGGSGGGGASWEKGRPVLATWGLAALALIAGINYFYGLRSGGSWLHRWDLFHTVTTARYFDELGYDGLYECTFTIGTEETGPFDDVRKIRDLKTNRYVRTSDLPATVDCEQLFTPEKREAFVRDLRFWRGLMPEGRWNRLLRDKGYNGTPYVTALARGLFSGGELSRSRLRSVALLDVLLVLVAFGFVARSFGLRVALVAFIFFCVSYPNRFTHMGGSVFRFSYIAYLIVAVAMLKDRRYGVAGVLIALAGMERGFPYLFAVAMLIKIGVDVWGERRFDPQYRRFVYGLVVTTGACFFLSVAVNGMESWAAFLENQKIHGQQTAGFRIGLRHLFMFTGNMVGPEGFVSFAEKEVLFRSRVVPFLIVVGVLFLPLLARVRRLPTTTFVVIFGLLSLFAFFYTTRYYYSVLVLLFLIAPASGRGWGRVSWFLLFAMAAVMYGVALVNPFPSFLYNTLFSSLLLMYFVFLMVALWCEPGGPSRSPDDTSLEPGLNAWPDA